jgi:hypothetical protein
MLSVDAPRTLVSRSSVSGFGEFVDSERLQQPLATLQKGEHPDPHSQHFEHIAAEIAGTESRTLPSRLSQALHHPSEPHAAPSPTLPHPAVRIQPFHLRKRRGFGRRGHPSGDGQVFQLSEPLGQLLRAHQDVAVVPATGGGVPDQQFPQVSAQNYSVLESVRQNSSGRVSGRVVAHPDQRGLPEGPHRDFGPRAGRGQSQVVLAHVGTDQVQRLGRRQLPQRSSEEFADPGEPTHRREWFGFGRRGKYQLQLLLAERFRFGDGLLGPVSRVLFVPRAKKSLGAEHVAVVERRRRHGLQTPVKTAIPRGRHTRGQT